MSSPIPSLPTATGAPLRAGILVDCQHLKAKLRKTPAARLPAVVAAPSISAAPTNPCWRGGQ